MMEIKQFEFNAFAENTYILYDKSGECIIVDPGCYEDNEKDQLVRFIDTNELNVVALINTHCHIDHVLGNHYVKQKFGVDLYIHEADNPTLKACEVVAPIYGFNNYEPTEADKFLKEGETVKFGHSELKVLFVPGHAPGHIALVNEEDKVCINGDVLFQGSIGRTDLPGGNFDTLISSIKNKMFELPNDTTVYCGHGPSTSIGFEKQHNPFCGIGVN
jgi:hydroxyacylglutathione hydrolase